MACLLFFKYLFEEQTFLIRVNSSIFMVRGFVLLSQSYKDFLHVFCILIYNLFELTSGFYVK